MTLTLLFCAIIIFLLFYSFRLKGKNAELKNENILLRTHNDVLKKQLAISQKDISVEEAYNNIGDSPSS